MSARICAALGMQIDPHPAVWEICVSECKTGHRRVNSWNVEYCPEAGFRRDWEMIEIMPAGGLVLSYALRWASGTGHCARRARGAGLLVADWGVDTTWEARPKRGRR